MGTNPIIRRLPLRTLIEFGPTAIIELTRPSGRPVLIDRFRAGLKRPRKRFKYDVLGVKSACNISQAEWHPDRTAAYESLRAILAHGRRAD